MPVKPHGRPRKYTLCICLPEFHENLSYFLCFIINDFFCFILPILINDGIRRFTHPSMYVYNENESLLPALDSIFDIQNRPNYSERLFYEDRKNKKTLFEPFQLWEEWDARDWTTPWHRMCPQLYSSSLECSGPPVNHCSALLIFAIHRPSSVTLVTPLCVLYATVNYSHNCHFQS